MAGVLVKYEEKARQKVAWVVLAGLPMGLTRLNLLLYPIIPRLYPIIPTGGGSSFVGHIVDDNGDDEHVWTWIRVVLISSGYYQKEQQGA